MPTMGPAPKVTREGIVMVDGKTVGSVERTRKDTSIYAAIGGYDGPVKWIPKDVDGKALSHPRDTRRDAVRMVAAHAEPLRVTVDRENDAYADGQLWVGKVNFQGHTIGASRRVGEAHWYVHFIWTSGAIIPRLSTLAGTRPADAINGETRPDIVDALNNAAREAGASF